MCDRARPPQAGTPSRQEQARQVAWRSLLVGSGVGVACSVAACAPGPGHPIPFLRHTREEARAGQGAGCQG